MSSTRQLIGELSRRGVFKAAGIYLAAGWVFIQVLDVVHQPLGLGDWVLGFTIWLITLGFPFTLFFSWRYDIGASGISLTPAADPSLPPPGPASRKDFAILALLGIILSSVALYLADYLQEETDSAITQDVVTRQINENSIGVLPFENLGGDEEHYLGQGLAEDILHRLTAIPGLQIASRTASFELDKTNLDMAAIGEHLAVRNVLEGSVRREGDRIRVVAQLIDTRTGYHLWSMRYDREVTGLFEIYDDISSQVTSQLKLTLAPDTLLAKAPPTLNMQAYDYFLQARSILRRATDAQSLQNSQQFFANAVELDPGFADAWAGQCRAYLEWHTFEPAPVLVENAEESCRIAIELDPDLTEGHVALGDLYRNTGVFEMAVPQYSAALADSPGLAIAWRGIGLTFEQLSRETEAEDALLKAVEIDPDDLLNLHALGDFYFYQGRYEEAERIYDDLTSHPRAGIAAFNTLGATRGMLGDYEGAAAAFRQVIALEPNVKAFANIGVIYYLLGQYDDAAIMLQEAVALSPEDAFSWSNLGDALRETDDGQLAALEAYQRAVDIFQDLRAVNPRDAEMLTNLAHCLARLGNDAEATIVINQAIDLSPGDPYTYYYSALIHLEVGRDDQALEALGHAVELNYPLDHLRTDPQFQPLKGLPEFEALLVPADG